MDHLPFDLILQIFSFSDAKDLCCSDVVSIFWNVRSKNNDKIWRNCAQWSEDFWVLAERRLPIFSKPLTTYREEVFRMLVFEDALQPYKVSKEDYLCLWEYLDRKNW